MRKPRRGEIVDYFEPPFFLIKYDIDDISRQRPFRYLAVVREVDEKTNACHLALLDSGKSFNTTWTFHKDHPDRNPKLSYWDFISE